ncbi:MAG: hypothetical protein DRN26_05095 [Thermoplasmata archaeon]|nr:MAG: hypothetical protein DRN26_05095 [Thermoplasmata archaeon]
MFMIIGAMNNPKEDVVSEIEAIVSAEYDYVELTVEPPMASREIVLERLSEIKSTASSSKRGIIVGHTAWYMPIVIPYDSVRKRALDELVRDFELFNKIGSVEYVVVHTSFSPGYESDDIMELSLIESLERLKREAEERGLRLLIENDPISPFSRYERVIMALDADMCLDLGHAFVVKGLRSGLLLAYRTGKLRHVHAHDNKGKKDEHLPIGAGKIPWDFVIKTLKAIGYNGTITVEDHSQSRDLRAYSGELLRKMWREIEKGNIWELLPVGP